MSVSSDGAGEGPGGESEVEGDDPSDMPGGQHDDADDDEDWRVLIEHEPRSSVGDEGDEGTAERHAACP